MTDSALRLLGQFDTSGVYAPFATPRVVYRFGNTLRDEDGLVLAVLDEYGDWVSPTLKGLGLKSVIKVEKMTEAEAEASREGK